MSIGTEEPHQVVFRATQFSTLSQDKLLISNFFFFKCLISSYSIFDCVFHNLLNLCPCFKSFAEIDSLSCSNFPESILMLSCHSCLNLLPSMYVRMFDFIFLLSFQFFRSHVLF